MAGVPPSSAARDLIRSADVVDAHVESFVWTRILGYDVTRRNGRGVFGARFYSQADIPRMREAGMSGAVFSIATNPFRSSGRRAGAFGANLPRLQAALERDDGVRIVRTAGEWRAARADGRFACFLAVQGGNAFMSPEDLDAIPGDGVTRVTLVHLTDSGLGATSSPLGRADRQIRRERRGLTEAGVDFVAALNERRILVDLAHANRPTFWAALDVHDRDLPPIVSHTGVWAMRPSWRNVDDDQIRAIAGRGGVVGVMYHRGFLGKPFWRVGAQDVVRHLEHLVRVGGEDVACLGSDWDGMIVTPRDMATAAELPVLVDQMLTRGWPEDRIRKVLGANYLQVMETIRP
jgi:membrane dipeptidase